MVEGLGGSCRSPVAALASLADGVIRLRAEILSEDGSAVETADDSFAAEDLDAPLAVARHLLARAAPSIRTLFDG